VGKDAAELVVLDLADERSARTEARRAHDRVRRRSAGHLDCRTHGVVDARRLRLVDQLHRALAHFLPGKEIVVGARENIDDRIADAEDVESTGGHQQAPE
jgi:hypothetical protein